MPLENPLRALWSEDIDAVGTWCELPSTVVAEILAGSGFDWVCLDWQHGLAGIETLGGSIQAVSLSGAAPIVRVPLNEPWLIQKALDFGAYGVMVPLVNTPEEARRAASACRYAPEGVRSYGPIRAAGRMSVDPADTNRNVVCMVQIEMAEAVDNVDEIAAAPGVDALFVGPYDLSLSLGLELGSPEVASVFDRIFAAARAAGIAVGRHCDTPADARTAFEGGFDFVAVGSDREALASSAVATATGARRTPRTPPADLDDRLCRIVVASKPD